MGLGSCWQWQNNIKEVMPGCHRAPASSVPSRFLFARAPRLLFPCPSFPIYPCALLVLGDFISFSTNLLPGRGRRPSRAKSARFCPNLGEEAATFMISWLQQLQARACCSNRTARPSWGERSVKSHGRWCCSHVIRWLPTRWSEKQTLPAAVCGPIVSNETVRFVPITSESGLWWI